MIKNNVATAILRIAINPINWNVAGQFRKG